MEICRFPYELSCGKKPRMYKTGRKALRKGRFSQKHGVYFITAVTDKRHPWFRIPLLAQTMCRHLADPISLADARNLCWVVMPNHFHALVELNETPLQAVLNRLKSRSAIDLNRAIGRSGRFWEPGFYDHALRTEENLRGIARYIVANPLRAELVQRIGDYPYWNSVWL
jgi:REP element-mobilizing transposase RayT